MATAGAATSPRAHAPRELRLFIGTFNLGNSPARALAPPCLRNAKHARQGCTRR
jgi:hypothetical protein